MTTLYLRATPFQARILRAVAGAVKNAADAHPGWPYTPRMARSIAKRAAGTLSSQWDDVLAAKPSERAGSDARFSPRRGLTCEGPRGSRLTWSRRDPLRLLWKNLSILTGEARKAGQNERAAAYIDVLRMIDAALSEPQP